MEAERIRVGTGAMESGATRDVIRRWQRDAAGSLAHQKAQKARPESLAEMGIGFRPFTVDVPVDQHG